MHHSSSTALTAWFNSPSQTKRKELIKRSSRRMPLEWRQLGTDVPFCKPPSYKEPFISWDLLFPPTLIQKALTHQTLMPPLLLPRKREGTARKHKGTANIWTEMKLVSKAFAGRCYGRRQEEGASGNSPASSRALQLNQSPEPLGGGCRWHSPPPPFLPAQLHRGGAGGAQK